MVKNRLFIALVIVAVFAMPFSVAYADDPTTTTVPVTTAPPVAPSPSIPDLDDPLPTDTTPPTSVPSKEDLIAKKKAEAANKNLDKASQRLLDTQLKIDQTTIAIHPLSSLACVPHIQIPASRNAHPFQVLRYAATPAHESFD